LGSTLQLWKFHVDFANTANSTFIGPTNLTVVQYNFDMCNFSQNCIPQPGTSVGLDPLADRLMYRLQYRNFGGYESLVVDHTVNVGSNHAGVRWYEVRNPGGTPVVYQQGTYAPDAVNRWVGSIAMDSLGDMALGFSASNGSVSPSIRYVGRLAGDALGTLPQAETTLVAGSGSQTGANRWGDYSTMSIDPSDDCTFWYTNEFYAATSSTGWSTEIGSFRFPGCPGNWVGNYGSAGYALAAWNGSSDLVDLPIATLTLDQGGRYVWTSSTTDVRALASPGQSTREAATWFHPTSLQLHLAFSTAYSGTLALYAVDWDNLHRQETVAANDGSGPHSATLVSFNQGAWLSFPVSVAAGGTVTVTVAEMSGGNAVLSGVFLGGTGPFHGNWVSAYGSSGYGLAAWTGTADVVNLVPATLSLDQGGRYVWAASTTDVRALESADQSTREAATWFHASSIQLHLSFAASYSGTLALYAVDWDNLHRQETITVNDGSGTQTGNLTSFDQGAWLTFSVNPASAGTVTITVTSVSGGNAVLSGIFLGGAGPLPVASTTAPQGDWVGTYGSAGYALGGWNSISDLVNLPTAALVVDQGADHLWTSSTTDVRALQSPDQSTRRAATWFHSTSLHLQLTFSASYAGTLALYAVDWDAFLRQETVTVVDAASVRSGGLLLFTQGAWLRFPINVHAGGTVTITINLVSSSGNAVLSGIFLGAV